MPRAERALRIGVGRSSGNGPASAGWAGNRYVYPSQLIAAIDHPQAEALVSELLIADATHLFPVSTHRQRAVDSFSDWAEHSFPD